MFLAEYPIKTKRHYCDLICKEYRETISGVFIDETGVSIGYYCPVCHDLSRMEWYLSLEMTGLFSVETLIAAFEKANYWDEHSIWDGKRRLANFLGSASNNPEGLKEDE